MNVKAMPCIVALLVSALGAPCDGFARGPSEQMLFEHTQPRTETLRLRVANSAGGEISASADGGESWRVLGSVVQPAGAVNPRGYTASKWAAASAVAATAVNAIHIKVADHPETGRGIVFSITPGGEAVGASQQGAGASIVTDMAGGTLIFGGYGPYVNSPVFVERDGEPVQLPPDYVPAAGDVLQIIRLDPARMPLYCTFENRIGGAVEIEYVSEEPRQIGRVLRAISGVGRFDGTLFAASGRLRANHCGVIDISTSPLGEIGGFQMIPREHARSPELSFVATSTQWLIVGPLDDDDPSWEGVEPLFAGYLLPSYRTDDVVGDHEDWMPRTLSRLLVQVRYEGGDWEPMPRICLDPAAEINNREQADGGRKRLWRIPASLNPSVPLPPDAYDALTGLSHIRIVFPQASYWPQDDGQEPTR